MKMYIFDTTTDIHSPTRYSIAKRDTCLLFIIKSPQTHRRVSWRHAILKGNGIQHTSKTLYNISPHTLHSNTLQMFLGVLFTHMTRLKLVLCQDGLFLYTLVVFFGEAEEGRDGGLVGGGEGAKVF